MKGDPLGRRTTLGMNSRYDSDVERASMAWGGIVVDAHTGIEYLNIEASNLKKNVWGAHKSLARCENHPRRVGEVKFPSSH